MKLDRSAVGAPHGKYGLIKIRKLNECKTEGNAGFSALPQILDALVCLQAHGILDWCDTPETEAFVIRLKDKYAGPALYEYAQAASQDDVEYARDVMSLAKRSGSYHPNCRRPD